MLAPGGLSCAPRPISREPASTDVVLNLVLFVPVVWLAPAPARRWAWVAAALLSLGAEAGQQWLFRTPSPVDWLANTGGALLATALPSPAWARLPRRALGVALLGGAAAGLLGAIALAAHAPPPRLAGWTPMPVVLGCEEPGKAYFEGAVRGVAVFDRVVAPPEGPVAELPPWAEGGPVYGLDFRRQRYWRDGPEGPAPLDLGPMPADFRLAQAGLHYGPSCWALPPAHTDAVLPRIEATGELSILLDVQMPQAQDGRVHRILSMTNLHMVRDFMTAGRGGGVFMWFRTSTLDDEHLDPLGPPAALDVAPGARGPILFTAGPERTQAFLGGECRQERLLSVLGRPFVVGRGLGFTAAVLVAMGAVGLGLLGVGRARPALALLGGGATMAGVLLSGLADQLGAAGAPVPAFMGVTLVAAWWALSGPTGEELRARGR